MSLYASTTTVSVEKSKGEIESTLRRYGAAAFTYGWNQEKAVVQFLLADRMMRFYLPLPNRAAREFTHSKNGMRSQERAHDIWEQACRQKWRALALVIKAKLEAVDSGITTVDEEFLAHMVLPNGETVHQFYQPQLKAVYEGKDAPKMLPGLAQ